MLKKGEKSFDGFLVLNNEGKKFMQPIHCQICEKKTCEHISPFLVYPIFPDKQSAQEYKLKDEKILKVKVIPQ